MTHLRLLLAFIACVAASCAPAPSGHASLVGADTSGAVDFGEVRVTERAEHRVWIHSDGPGAVQLVDIAWVGEAPTAFSFSLDGAAPKWLAPEERVALDVTFRPERTGPRVATLRIRLRDAWAEQELFLVLTGMGRADVEVPTPAIAKLEVLSQVLTFGQVPLVPGAQAAATGTIVVRNGGGPGSVLRVKSFEVAPLTPATRADELTVSFGTARSLRAGERFAIPVRFLPTTLGQKAWRISVHSDAPEQPSVDVALTAEVLVPGPCQLSFPTAGMQFGSVQRYDARPRVLRVENTSLREPCVVWDVQLGAQSQLAFALEGAPAEPVLLRAGAALEVTVWAQPPEPGTFTGTLTFRTSSPEQPAVSLPLHAEGGMTPCLRVSPLVDFGPQPILCIQSQVHLALIEGVCEGLRLRDYQLTELTSPEAGTPECPGPSRCPEFILSQAPAIPSAGLPLSNEPVLLGLRYRPVNVGEDAAVLELSFAGPIASHTERVDVRASAFEQTRVNLITAMDEENGEPQTLFPLSAQAWPDTVTVRVDGAEVPPISGSERVWWLEVAGAVRFEMAHAPAEGQLVELEFLPFCGE